MPITYGNSGKDACIRGLSCPFGRVDPKGLHWVLVDHEINRSNGGCKVVATTDVPVILFAYVSDKWPKKKRGSHTKRGATFAHDAEVYWSIKDIVCQEEDGLTLTHTFYLNCYEYGGSIWWRYGGRTSKVVAPLQPIWSASKSAFYSWSCAPAPLIGDVLVDCWLNVANGHAITVFPPLLNKFVCNQGDILTGVKVKMNRSPLNPDDRQYGRMYLVKLTPDETRIAEYVWTCSSLIYSEELSTDWTNPTEMQHAFYVRCEAATYALLITYISGDMSWIILWNSAGVVLPNPRNATRGWNFPFTWDAPPVSCYTHQIYGLAV